MRQVKALRTNMLLTTFCFTAVSHMSSYKQCVLQKKYNRGCFHFQPLHDSMGEKGTFVLWNHWIGWIFITTAKATLALFPYPTFLSCSYVILITLIKTIMGGKDKVTVWSSTEFSCNTDTMTAHHSHVVLCWHGPCLGNRSVMVSNKYTILGTEWFYFPKLLMTFPQPVLWLYLEMEHLTKKVITFKWSQEGELVVQLDYWAYKTTYQKSVPVHFHFVSLLHVRMND